MAYLLGKILILTLQQCFKQKLTPSDDYGSEMVRNFKLQKHLYGIHLRTKIIENKRQFEVQKLDYLWRNLVI